MPAPPFEIEAATIQQKSNDATVNSYGSWSDQRAIADTYPRRVGFAINTTSNGCPNVPASYAGGNRQILIIFGSRSRERSGARSATSLLSPYAGLTTAKCTGPVTKWVGGNRRV